MVLLFFPCPHELIEVSVPGGLLHCLVGSTNKGIHRLYSLDGQDDMIMLVFHMHVESQYVDTYVLMTFVL